jgi:hypothetical protein
MPDGTVCNPAFLGEVKASSLLGQAFIGNGYAAISAAEKFVFKPISREFLAELFEKQPDTSLEAQAGLIFTTRYFSAGFHPYRVQYVSEVHNPNFPVMSIHASVERMFSFAGGVSLSGLSNVLSGFSFGARLSFFERNYVHGAFSLFDALAEDPHTLLPVSNHKGVAIEPAIAWNGPTPAWKTHMSLAVTGQQWSSDPVRAQKTDLALGMGVVAPVPYGDFSLGIDMVNLVHAPDVISRIRLSGSYKLGVTEIMAGLNDRSVATGLHFGFELVQAGIVYEFLRNDFGGVSPESKIATELCIKL